MNPHNEWARCRPYIERALAHGPGLETIGDVERLIADGTYQFWPGVRSAAITAIQRHARKKVLAVIHGGGDLRELLDEMEPAFCAFARAAGCDAIIGIGRKGWERETTKRGYRFAHLTMIKEL
jgi:hypothetical protein